MAGDDPMNDLEKVKVGDILYIREGHYDVGRLQPAERVTPSGRVKCSAGEFNSDGSLRGGGVWCRTFARIATKADIEKVEHHALAQRVRSQISNRWAEFNTSELTAMAAIVEAANARIAGTKKEGSGS